MKGNKKDKTNTVINEPISPDALETSAVATTTEPAPVAKKKTSSKQTKKGNAKNEKKENGFVRFFKRIGRAFKEMGSELKKVSWPTFGKALTSTGIVLAVVAIFLLVLTGMDFLLGLGFKSLIGLG